MSYRILKIQYIPKKFILFHLPLCSSCHRHLPSHAGQEPEVILPLLPSTMPAQAATFVPTSSAPRAAAFARAPWLCPAGTTRSWVPCLTSLFPLLSHSMPCPWSYVSKIRFLFLPFGNFSNYQMESKTLQHVKSETPWSAIGCVSLPSVASLSSTSFRLTSWRSSWSPRNVPEASMHQCFCS